MSKLDIKKYNKLSSDIVNDFFKQYIIIPRLQKSGIDIDNKRVEIKADEQGGSFFVLKKDDEKFHTYGAWDWEGYKSKAGVYLASADKIESNYTSEMSTIKAGGNITLKATNDIENLESNILANGNVDITAKNLINKNFNIAVKRKITLMRDIEYHGAAMHNLKWGKTYDHMGQKIYNHNEDKGNVIIEDEVTSYVGTGKNAKISAGGNIKIEANKVGNGLEIKENVSIKSKNQEINSTKVDKNGVNLDSINIDKKNTNVDEIVLNKKNLEPKEEIDTKDYINLPKNDKGLFRINNNIDNKPGFSYLVETNINFIDKSRFFGSEYFFKRIGFNPDRNIRLLGDSFYETKLINKAILEGTGRRFLSGYKSDKEQMQALYDNAVSEQADLNLSVGIALSKEQIAKLKKDIIWYVEEEVQGQKVLVPKVYLTRNTLSKLKEKNASIEAGQELTITAKDIQNTGNLSANNITITTDNLTNKTILGANKASIDGNTVNITAKNSVDNIGADIKAKENLTVTAKDISNLSTKRTNGYGLDTVTTGENLASIQAKNVTLDAGNNIQNSGAKIKADEKVDIKAKNVKIDTIEESRYFHDGNSNNYTTIDNKSNIASNIEAKNINMEAKKDIDIKGSNVVAKNEVNIKADGDVNIVSATDSRFYAHKETSKGKFGKSSSEENIAYATRNVASNIIGDKVNITSGKDVNIFGSNVGAKDTGNISAKGTITEAAAKEINYSYHKKTKTGFMGLSGKSSAEKIRQELNAESNLYVKNQGIIGGDVKVIGSNLVLGNNSIINGKLTTDSNELHNSYSYEESKKGFSGSIGGGGFSVGYGKSESGLKEKDVTNAKSNLVLGDGTVLNKGADITATNLTHGKIIVNNGDVKFGARKDTKDVETYSKSSGVNLSVKIKSPALDRAKQWIDSFRQMKSGDILGGIASTTNTVTGVVSGLASNQGTKLPLSAVNKNNSDDDNDDNQDNTVGKDNLKAAQATNNFYANVGANLGFNKSSSKTNSHNERAVVTTIKGKDKDSSITYNDVKNIEYVGTQAQNTKFIYNNVDNIDKRAVELNNSYSSDSKSSGVSTGVTIGYGDGVQTEANGVSISASKSKMNTNGTNFQNGRFINVDEVHNNTKNMTLSGFNQESGTVTGNIENLTIESKQNTSSTTGSTKGGSIGFAPNGMPTSISANYSQTNGERKYVDTPTTFIIGEGSNLKVGKVDNKASAIGTTGNGKLSIDEYVGHNLENVDKSKTVGGSVGISTSGINSIGINYSDRKQERITKNTVIGNVEIGKSSGTEINKDLDTMTEITKDRNFKTNVNIESQTIKYALNPEAFKQDLAKAKDEITDIGSVVENSISPKGKDKRNIFANLRAQRWNTSFYNVTGSRMEELSRQFKAGEIDEKELKEAARDLIKGYGKDIGIDFEVLYLDEATMPKDAKGSTGSAFINKETEKMLIPIDVNKIKDTGSLWGVIAEEVSHIQDGLEGRQDKKVAEDETNKEKGLESLGRPINDYVKNKLGDDNSSDIQLSTDGIDLTNANVGEKVGDYFPKQEIDAAGGVKKVFGWDPDKGITLTETGHFLTGFSEAILADMLLNPNLIPEKYKYRSLAYKYGELTGHSTMIGVGCIGSVSGECLQGVGVGAAGGTAGASLGISWVGVGVETYSLGLTTVSTINAAKTNSQISAMKAVGSSGSGGTNNSDENSEKKEENINKDDKGSENNKEPNNDEKKQTPKKPEDNFNKKTNPNASTNKTQSGKATLNEGKQGKHVVGHNNFQQGKSEVDMETARNVLNDFQDTGQKFFDENGQKLKEVVDTNGKYTGIFVDKDTGQRSITSRFTIHYDSKGTAHIVPANPNPK